VLVLIYSTLFGRQPREVTPAKRQIPSPGKAIEPPRSDASRDQPKLWAWD